MEAAWLMSHSPPSGLLPIHVKKQLSRTEHLLRALCVLTFENLLTVLGLLIPFYSRGEDERLVQGHTARKWQN